MMEQEVKNGYAWTRNGAPDISAIEMVGNEYGWWLGAISLKRKANLRNCGVYADQEAWRKLFIKWLAKISPVVVETRGGVVVNVHNAQNVHVLDWDEPDAQDVWQEYSENGWLET